MKVGVFGGTFDPVHNGHVAVAKAAADAHGLERVLLIPSGIPPHKQAPATASFEERYRMVELACGADPRLVPSRLEAPAKENHPHYTVDTIQRIRDEGPADQQLFFIVGADAFAEIGTWYRWRELLEMVEIIVVSRAQASGPPTSPSNGKVHWLDGVDVPVSSTQIRERLRLGRPVDEQVPPAVADYLRQHKLYRNGRRSAATPR